MQKVAYKNKKIFTLIIKYDIVKTTKAYFSILSASHCLNSFYHFRNLMLFVLNIYENAGEIWKEERSYF